MKRKEVLEYKKPATQKTNTSEEKARALHYERELGIYSSDPQVKLRQHMCVAECATHVRRKELPAFEMLKSRMHGSAKYYE